MASANRFAEPEIGCFSKGIFDAVEEWFARGNELKMIK